MQMSAGDRGCDRTFSIPDFSQDCAGQAHARATWHHLCVEVEDGKPG